MLLKTVEEKFNNSYCKNNIKLDPYLVVVLKKFDSRFISSDLNFVISSSIFRISASNRSLMLLNSVSITLKSPNLIGMSRFTLSAILHLIKKRRLPFKKYTKVLKKTAHDLLRTVCDLNSYCF